MVRSHDKILTKNIHVITKCINYCFVRVPLILNRCPEKQIKSYVVSIAI